MRILPRFHLPSRKAARRLWRRSSEHFSVRRVYYSLEFILFLTIYLLVFSGDRLRTIDAFGHRTDAVVSLILVAAFILFNVIARRLLLPGIERYYEPTPYDERKIFFDLGQGTRYVSTIDHLYQQLAERVRTALDSSSAAIFVRDDVTEDFNLRVLAVQGRAAETSPDGKRLQLSKRAFVVRRLLNLSTPLVIEPHEIETWSQALNAVLPSLREERASEHNVLRTTNSHDLTFVAITQEKQDAELHPGFALRSAHDGQASGIYFDRCAHTRSWHRRKHRYLLRG